MAKVFRKSGRVTYSRLEKVLTTLGFVRKETDGFTAYREAEHDALIVLPRMSAGSDVGEPHLVTVRNTVTGKGIASLGRFQMLLAGLHVKPVAGGLRTRTPRHREAFMKPHKPGLKVRDQQPARVERAYKKYAIKKH